MKPSTIRRLAIAKRVLNWVIVGLIVVEIGIVGHALGAGRDTDTVEVHHYVDAVLVPRFCAAWAEWAIGHPQDKPGSVGSHYRTVDAGDVKRGHAMHESMKELERSLGSLGY